MPNILDAIQVSGASYDLKDKNAPSVSSLTQSEYDNLPSTAKTSNTFFVITDAQAGDLTNYYTKNETNTLLGGKADTATTYTKIEVDTALAGKQTTLTAGTGISIVDNVISATGGGGGGKAVSAGRGISVTTGETAYTISVSLPISAGTGTNSVVEGAINNRANGDFSHAEGGGTSAMTSCSHAEGIYTAANGYYSHAEGMQTLANGETAHAEGYTTVAKGAYSHAEGYKTSATSISSHAEGAYNSTSNSCEHASGRYNITTSASTTFGDSGNTLFSVGNGTSASARHNAFEIRQNGDIYFTLNGQDVKLQDHLGGGGGGGTVDQTFDRDSTNAIANSAVTRNTVGSYGSASTGGKTLLQAYDQKGHGVDKLSIGFSKINNTPIFKIYSNLFELTNFSLVETSAITTSVTSSSTDSEVPSAKCVYDQVGGLKLVKLSQSEYDNLQTKDNSTLYVIVN